MIRKMRYCRNTQINLDQLKEGTYKSKKGTIIWYSIVRGKREFYVCPKPKNSYNWSIYESLTGSVGNCYAELNRAYRDLLSYGDKQAWRWLIRHARELEVPGGKKLKDFLIGGTFVDVDALIKFSGDTYNYPYAPRWGRRRI